MSDVTPTERDRLVEVEIDPASLAPASPAAENERRVAVFDLLQRNVFVVEGEDSGPYRLKLSRADRSLVFDVFTEVGDGPRSVLLAMAGFRKIVKDYALICDSYYEAIRHATPQQIEAVDMGRRAMHNEGAELLLSRLKSKIHVDDDTSRRLFTLICALHFRP